MVLDLPAVQQALLDPNPANPPARPPKPRRTVAAAFMNASLISPSARHSSRLWVLARTARSAGASPGCGSRRAA
jgi:hypothetical protein